eukprot:Selendium_serpulae@DN6381_c0_g1_i5.p1
MGQSAIGGQGDATAQSQTDLLYRGLDNLGNTCYCNSVIQALYYCEAFRNHCLQHRNDENSTLLCALAEVFHQISIPKGRADGATRKLLEHLFRQTGTFRIGEHHDAHEFFNFLVNDIAESLCKSKKGKPTGGKRSNTTIGPEDIGAHNRTWVHMLFEGTLVYETKCDRCETVTKRSETFIDLSVEVQDNATLKKQDHTTLEECIAAFTETEVLERKEKYECDSCTSPQRARRKLKLGRLPPFLTVHLKRFKFGVSSGQYSRLNRNVQFPLKLELPGYPEKYTLLAAIVHIGQTIQHGHYVCVACHKNKWRLFDDYKVQVVDQSVLKEFYGGVRCGYLLVYQQESPQSSSHKQSPVSSSSSHRQKAKLPEG